MADFRRGQSGAVAVEFALMSIPLITLAMLAVDLYGNDETFQRIDAAAYAVVKTLRDGSTPPAAYTLASARDMLVCPRLPKLNCASIVVTLAPLASAARLSASNVSAARWCAPGGQAGLVFQVAYPVPFLTRLWAGDLESRKPYFVSSFALRDAAGQAAEAC